MTDQSEAQEVMPEQASGEQAESWRTGLPEGLRDHPSLARMDSVEALGKSYINAEKMIGYDKIAVPNENSSIEQWNDTWSKLGRPSEPGKYELNIRESLPEGMEPDENLAGAFKEKAHAIGLNTKQAQEIVSWVNEMQGQVPDAGAEFEKNAVALEEQSKITLQKEFGKAFDDKVNIAKSVLREYGGEGLLDLQLADGTQLSNNPFLVKTFANIGDFMKTRLGEDTLKGSKSQSGAMTPNEAQIELDKVMVKNGPYWNRDDPGHQQAVARAYQLNGFIAGEDDE